MSPHQTPGRFGRRTILKSTLGLGALAAVGGGTAYALSGPTGQSRAAVTVKKIADLTGGDLTGGLGVGGTDLGIPVVTPKGQKLFIFGDSYKGEAPNEEEAETGTWRSPIGLFTTTEDLNQGLKWDKAIGGDYARQLWEYEHNNPEFSTVLPSDVVTIGDTMYLQVMVHKGLANVLRCEIWKSSDEGDSWQKTPAEWDGALFGGRMQVWTWALNEQDNHVYVYSTRFERNLGVLMHRVPVDKIEDSTAYQWWGYDGSRWDWNIGDPQHPEKSEIWTRGTGEMCLRPMEGKWLWTWFNEQDRSIDGMILDSPTDDLNVAPHKQLIYGTEWGDEDDSHVAQLYGGYIIPGSTINDLHLMVSQWKTDDNSVYHVMQHRVQGLAD